MRSTRIQREEAAEDAALYAMMMVGGNCHGALLVEERWGLDGYPPGIVSSVLARVADGQTIDDALEAIEG